MSPEDTAELSNLLRQEHDLRKNIKKDAFKNDKLKDWWHVDRENGKRKRKLNQRGKGRRLLSFDGKLYQ